MAVTTFDPPYPKTHAARKHHGMCLIERELVPIEVLHCGNTKFRPFRLLWPWPWPDNLHIWTRPVDCGDIPHVQIWTSCIRAYVRAFLYCLTDIHTDRQTRPKLYTMPLRGWSKITSMTLPETRDNVQPHMSNHEPILLVNYFCHMFILYAGSTPRTFGNCGTACGRTAKNSHLSAISRDSTQSIACMHLTTGSSKYFSCRQQAARDFSYFYSPTSWSPINLPEQRHVPSRVISLSYDHHSTRCLRLCDASNHSYDINIPVLSSSSFKKSTHLFR